MHTLKIQLLLTMTGILYVVAPFAGADLLTWDGGASDNLIYRDANWNPDGQPKNGNSGIVPDGFTAESGWSDGTDGYVVSFNGNSSFVTSSNQYYSHGTDLTFNDT